MLGARRVVARAPARSAIAPAMSSTADPSPRLCQYVVLRRDLARAPHSWPVGALSAQTAHACVAAIWTYRDRAETMAYCDAANIASMRKVVLEAKTEAQLRALSETLTAAGVEHALWLEQPENVATCLATRPYEKEVVGGYFKKYNLAKDVFSAPT